MCSYSHLNLIWKLRWLNKVNIGIQPLLCKIMLGKLNNIWQRWITIRERRKMSEACMCAQHSPLSRVMFVQMRVTYQDNAFVVHQKNHSSPSSLLHYRQTKHFNKLGEFCFTKAFMKILATFSDVGMYLIFILPSSMASQTKWYCVRDPLSCTLTQIWMYSS